MRILISMKTRENFVYNEINQYFIQSFIWNLLRDTGYSGMHDKPNFKFFSFSNIFPVSDFKENEEKQFIISSPDKQFIEILAEKLGNIKQFRLGIHEFEMNNVKKFSATLSQNWQTATPIVLYENNNANRYYSVKRNPDLGFFLERLKDNALKKYNIFYNENLNFEEPLFDRMFFKKQVAVHLRKAQKEFLILGTIWKFEINLLRCNNEKRKFYNFIMDCGLGEKNSLGFGFVNTIRERQKNSEKPIMTYEEDE